MATNIIAWRESLGFDNNERSDAESVEQANKRLFFAFSE